MVAVEYSFRTIVLVSVRRCAASVCVGGGGGKVYTFLLIIRSYLALRRNRHVKRISGVCLGSFADSLLETCSTPSG